MLRLSINVSRELLRTSKNVQKLTKCNFSHLTYNTTNVSLRKNDLFNVHKHSRISAIYVVRHQSSFDSEAATVTNTQEDKTFLISSTVVPDQQIQDTTEYTQKEDIGFISEIPDAPIPPSEELTSVVTEVLTATGEPTFKSLGLGGYGPTGIVENCLEWFHIGCGLPWWASITVLTLIIKIVSFIPAINITKNAVKMSNIMPQMMEIQDKLSEARRSGNTEEVALYSYKLQMLMRKNGVNASAISNTIARIVITVPPFFALREMTAIPIESLKTGGLWWFTDLTVTDQYYLLPLIANVGMYLVAQNAMKAGHLGATRSSLIKYVFRALPIIGFCFAINFPGAVLYYWFLTNAFTLLQNEILKMKKVREFLNIPATVHHEIKTNTSLKKTGFMESFSQSWTNIRISQKVANRLRADETQFNAAGKGPVKKTFKYNPLTNQHTKSVTTMKK